MIISSTRSSSTKCWRRTFNLYHRNLNGEKSMNLVDGGAVHKGIAHGLATKDWAAAREVLSEGFKIEAATSTIPEEQSFLLADHLDMCLAILDVFEERVGHEPYTVVQPEAALDVPIPNSHHHCLWMHWRKHITPAHGLSYWEDQWRTPTPDEILKKQVHPAHVEANKTCPCWTPHRVVGQTDAIVLWEGNMWLLEHKTTAITGDNFWAGFELDLQPTIYLWGIWKTLGIQPRGFILNALKKPSEKQVSAWNAKRKDGLIKTPKDYLDMERQAILRSTEDLERAPAVLKALCDEWEWRMLRGDFRPALNKTVCVEYGRRCEFHTPCSNHESEGSFSGLLPREQRYDDQKIAELVQIGAPCK